MTDRATGSKAVAGPWEDPVVAEVRAERERLLAEAGGSIDGLVAFLRAKEAEHPERLVSRTPERSGDGGDATNEKGSAAD